MLSIAKIHKFTAKLTITGGNNVRPMSDTVSFHSKRVKVIQGYTYVAPVQQTSANISKTVRHKAIVTIEREPFDAHCCIMVQLQLSCTRPD